MSYIDDFKSALFDAVSNVTQLPSNKIYFMYQGVSEPSGNSLAIFCNPITQVGGPFQGTLTDDSETLLIRNEYTCRVQFIFIGDESSLLCTEFVHNLSHVKFWQEFGFRNLSILNKRPIQFQPEKRDTKWVPRYAVDITFGFASESRELVDVIEKVQFTDLDGNLITIPY